MSRQRRGQYERLPQDVSPESSGRTFQERPENDIRFRYNPRVSPPWKSIIMAIFLLSLGSLLLILSYLIFTGHMRGAKDQAFGLLVLGLLVFLPGESGLCCHTFSKKA